MTQVKMFIKESPSDNPIEKQVNDFLEENDGKITVKDVKYDVMWPCRVRNSEWLFWTALVLYDVIEEK